jgi:hypothetical protein
MVLYSSSKDNIPGFIALIQQKPLPASHAPASHSRNPDTPGGGGRKRRNEVLLARRRVAFRKVYFHICIICFSKGDILAIGTATEPGMVVWKFSDQYPSGRWLSRAIFAERCTSAYLRNQRSTSSPPQNKPPSLPNGSKFSPTGEPWR